MLQHGDTVTAYLLHKSMEQPGGQNANDIDLDKSRSLPSRLGQHDALCSVIFNEKQR